MKASVRLLLVAALVAVLAIPMMASAQSGGPYTSGFQLQNLSGSTANISISYYNQNGTSGGGPVADTINANSSKTYFPLTAVASGFNGSAVVSSDQPLAAITNVLTSDMLGGASYSGATAGATTVNLPLIMKQNFNYSTWFNIQNAGSSAADITVAFSGQPTCNQTATIQPGAAATFDQLTHSCLPAGYVGAATVTNASTNQPLVAVVMEILSGGKSLLAYNGFTSAEASNTPVMPLVSTGWFGSFTGIQIQNTGGSATDVTVSYTPSAGFPGAACTDTKNIPANSSVSFFVPAGTCGASFVGAAKVSANTASQALVAIVNQINTGNATSSAYAGINPGQGSSNVSLPLIMDRNFGYFTGIAVANVGASATDINCTFTGTGYTASATGVAPGAALTNVQLNQIASGYVGSATCTATGGDAKIAGIVNELATGASSDDKMLTYNGANY
jgi:hypothetical protein